MIEPRRDWGEYVMQSDLDVTLYEATILVYELADVLKQIKYGSSETDTKGHHILDILRPHLDKALDLVSDDIDRFTEDDEDEADETDE